MIGRDRRVILVVTAADRAQANVDAQAAVPGCGADTFHAGIVPAASAPGATPSHYWCSWQVTADEAAALRALFGQGARHGRVLRPGIALRVPRTVDGDVEQHADAVLAELGLERPRAIFPTRA